ncbi:MAG TPA: hypothetical protein VFB34_07575 [Chloroflexota bacterium]|nr:hypothetical protein [Chloroflexota bacterium]
MDTHESEFWNRIRDYESGYREEDYRGAAVAIALALRREAEDMFADLADNADYASDTDDTEGYVRWLQRAGEDVSYRISQALSAATSDEQAEIHVARAYMILREVCADALSRLTSD